MNISNIPSSQPERISMGYTLTVGKGDTAEVHPSHYEEAAEIDTIPDHKLTDEEIKEYLKKREIIRDPRCNPDEEKLLRDYKLTLQNLPLEQVNSYHSYDQLVADLKALAEKYPDKAELISLGKTPEGRDIWDLKITKRPENTPSTQTKNSSGVNITDNPQWLISDEKMRLINQDGENNRPAQPGEQPPAPAPKPGVVITGLHHAREWISMEVPLYAAKQILANYDTDPAMKYRVDNAVIHIIPLVNPDGYEYSRLKDSWWRKNRQPISTNLIESDKGNLGDPSGERVQEERAKGIGIDLNRNYMDSRPEYFHFYRPPGDTPGSTYDDYGASDRITSDQYRGPAGAYAPEVKVMQDLISNPENNIKAAIDFHSYGKLILYPYGHSYEHIPDEAEFAKHAENMAKIINSVDHDGYRAMKSSDLYPATGSSEDYEYINNVKGFTIELDRTFAPDKKDIEPICRRLLGAQLYLIDLACPPPPEPQPAP